MVDVDGVVVVRSDVEKEAGRRSISTAAARLIAFSGAMSLFDLTSLLCGHISRPTRIVSSVLLISYTRLPVLVGSGVGPPTRSPNLMCVCVIT